MRRLIPVVLLIPVLLTAQAPEPPEWRYFGGDKGFTRYSALDQINRDNVKYVAYRLAAPGGESPR